MAYTVCHAPRIISETLPEIHIMKTCDFLNSISHSKMFFSIIGVLKYMNDFWPLERHFVTTSLLPLPMQSSKIGSTSSFCSGQEYALVHES